MVSPIILRKGGNRCPRGASKLVTGQPVSGMIYGKSTEAGDFMKRRDHSIIWAILGFLLFTADATFLVCVYAGYIEVQLELPGWAWWLSFSMKALMALGCLGFILGRIPAEHPKPGE